MLRAVEGEYARTKLLMCVLMASGTPTWFASLRAHVRQLGGLVDVGIVEHAPNNAGRGLIASRAARAGEEVLAVPYGAIVSPRTLPPNTSTAAAAALQEYDQHLIEGERTDERSHADLALVAFLLESRRGDNADNAELNHAAYVLSLPADPPQSFLSWPEAWQRAADVMTGSTLSWVSELLAQARILVKRLARGPPAKKDIEWAVGVVMSRRLERGLVPILDIANHAFQANSKHECDDARQLCVLTLLNDINVGDDVFINYGNLGNTLLLGFFGFSVPGNPYASAGISWPDAAAAPPEGCRDLHPLFSLLADENTALPVHSLECLSKVTDGRADGTTFGKTRARDHILDTCSMYAEAARESQDKFRALALDADRLDAAPIAKILHSEVQRDVDAVHKCITELKYLLDTELLEL